MSNYSPTTDELKRKSVRELQAIFRKASQIAESNAAAGEEREAAVRTMESIKRRLRGPSGP